MKDVGNLSILKNIFPHQRVESPRANGVVEIFDLYQLGSFSAPNSFLSSYITEPIEKTFMYENLELVALPGKATYQPHLHKKSAAVIYIISGTGSFLLGDETIEYKTKQRIVVPAGLLHGFQTLTETLFLSIQSPPIIDPETQNVDLYYQG